MQNLKAKLQNQTAKKGGNSVYFKPTVGRNVVTILPLSYEDDAPWVLFNQHYIDGQYSICKGEGCPYCAKGWALYNENGKKISDEAKKWLPSQKAALNVNVNGDNKVWVISKTMLDQIIEIDEQSNGDIFNVEDGRDLIVMRTGEGKLTKYNLSAGLEKRTLENWAEIKMTAPDLDEVIRGVVPTF